MTKDEKQNLLDMSANAVETGHQFLDWLQELHNTTTEVMGMSNDEVDKLVDEDEDFDKAQKAMDDLYERMQKMGVA